MTQLFGIQEEFIAGLKLQEGRTLGSLLNLRALHPQTMRAKQRGIGLET